MPKAIIEFDLSEPDEKETFARMSKADEVYACLWDYSQLLREYIKYPESAELTDDQVKVLELARDGFFDILTGHGIDLDKEYS